MNEAKETKKRTVTLEQDRYEELLAREERLRLMEIALAGMDGYGDINPIKTIFGIKAVTTNEQ